MDSSEVRTTAATSASKEKALKAAVKAADIPRLTDYGHAIALTTYPKGTSIAKIVGDVTGADPDDVTDDNFETSSGDKAVAAFASALDDEAKQLLENAEDAEDKTAAGALTDLAAKARSFFLPATQFTAIVAKEHSIAEDGDLESHTLVATNKDGSLLVLSYTDFPF